MDPCSKGAWDSLEGSQDEVSRDEKSQEREKKHKNAKSMRVQSHNGRVSEVSCENCTHIANAAQKNLSKVCYIQRDISGIGLHHESCWDWNGIAMRLNLYGITMRSNSVGLPKESR